MSEPVFTRKKSYTLTFEEDRYFTGLHENAGLIAETLRLGRDEAGVLDKKLAPELLSGVGKIIELLHDPEYRDEAEQELARQNDPDVAIVILRQAFKIRTDRVKDVLARKLIELCLADETGVAQEAIREATGSQLQRLSQLADEVFLKVGSQAELQQVAADPRRTMAVRIRACHRLIDRHRQVEAVPIALGLWTEGGKQPAVREHLKRLSKAFGALETLEATVIQEHVVAPLLQSLERYQRDGNIRWYLLLAIGELHEAVLADVRETPAGQIGRGDMWLALTLQQCAFRSPAATQLMINWMGNQEVDDVFRKRLSIRIKGKHVLFPQGAEDDLKAVLEDVPYIHEKEMRQNIGQAISNAAGKDERRPPKELYAEILEQYGNVDDRLLWEFRGTPGSWDFLHSHVPSMGEEQLELLLQIIYHEGYNSMGAKRLSIILDAYPRLQSTLKEDALRIIYKLARNEPQTNKAWRQAQEFLADLVEAGDDDSELARRYWKKLGESG